MSLRIQMLQVARCAQSHLGEATDLVRAFYAKQLHDSGGGCDRSGRPDLYYSVFVLNGFEALDMQIPRERVAAWLNTFGGGEELDLVHASSLARCWSIVGRKLMSRGLAKTICNRIESFRKPDGGYDVNSSQEHGTAYGAFLALGAYQDLGKLPPSPLSIVRGLKRLETPDHAWNNGPSMKIGSTNPTAGAVILLNSLHLPIHEGVGRWLLAQLHSGGGFLAVPGAPMPDLLSTATALHALAALDVKLTSTQRERCLDFLDSLWSAEGGFHGHWADDHLDAEYTFYGLLALGHLA